MITMDAVLKIAKHGGRILVKRAPDILKVVGTGGVIAAVILAAKKAPDAKVELEEVRDEWEAVEDKEKRVKADYIFKLVRVGAKHYWVVAAVAGGAITAFWIADHMRLKSLISALTALGLATKSKEELEAKIKELDGDKHLQKILDEIDGDRVKNNPPTEENTFNTGLGLHLCYEPITGRYFQSNIERVKRAVIVCRDDLQKYGYLSLNDWFCALCLDTTDQNLCWTASSIEEVNDFDISFSSQITPEGIPVLVIRYNVNPTLEHRDW